MNNRPLPPGHVQPAVLRRGNIAAPPANAPQNPPRQAAPVPVQLPAFRFPRIANPQQNPLPPDPVHPPALLRQNIDAPLVLPQPKRHVDNKIAEHIYQEVVSFSAFCHEIQFLGQDHTGH